MLWLLQAFEEEMGPHGLRLILRQAGLEEDYAYTERYATAVEWYSHDCARLLHAIRLYYGLGARGTLVRIGRKMWQLQIARHPVRAAVRKALLLFLPRTIRKVSALKDLAARLDEPDTVTLERENDVLWLVDRGSERTYGSSAANPSCWTALGEIAECVLWATGQEPMVSEVSCKLMGAEACRFEIR
jgi:predicted hydrocarbon binding protein